MPNWANNEGRYWYRPPGRWLDSIEVPHPPVVRQPDCSCAFCASEDPMTITPIRIRSGQSSMTQFRTFCSYGDLRTGKSRWAGTSPNALFISDASERGWTTLETMPESDYYHHGQGPVVLPVADQIDMTFALAAAERWVKAGYISTVVVDSLTFYAESWFQHELRKMIAAGGKMDTRALYGGLAQHLTDVRQMVHKWPCNVIWLALASPPDEDNKGGPMVSGKARNRFPSACDHIFYHERYLAVDEAGAEVEVYQIRTRPPANYLGGGRDSGALPVQIPWPTFRYVAECLSLPEFPRRELPDEELAKVMQTMPSAAQVASTQASTTAGATSIRQAAQPLGRNGKPPGRPALR